MDVTKPYEFIGFGAMDVTKPYEFIGFAGHGFVCRIPLSFAHGKPVARILGPLAFQ